ncbi:PorT family protein [Mucilaginibacter sp. 14171R-50]|uniref:PorT family protein n=1 Tax=Mucilaginibacter sp. 14171R-50 TaxID=2703789 RepID=UPI00138D9E32|nr:PorT family protein [Mucilaginibacter sp. 14171R-50]QHS56153.1 PorT family protein [Mucilaginibacter sp. 14171R-50]
MKRILLVAVLVAFALQLSAQKIEVSIYASAGLSHYVGNYVTTTTYIGPSASPTNTIDKRDNNPYGNKSGFSNSFGLQAQYVSKPGIIGGLQAGIENLRSQVHIDELKGTYPTTYHYDGTSTLIKQFFNLNPYLGYRLSLNNIKIDLMPGLDFGVKLSSRQKIRTNSEIKYTAGNDKVEDISVDRRVRFGSAIYYKRIGLTASYSRGLNNYVETTKGAQNTARSEIMRLGLIFRAY